MPPMEFTFLLSSAKSWSNSEIRKVNLRTVMRTKKKGRSIKSIITMEKKFLTFMISVRTGKA